MEQALAEDRTGESNPVDETGLCLLSLDGGGVRGLSTLYILKGLMTRLNHERGHKGLQAMKPCEIFDLIGGTSTGGLIAIMLGRLEMGVDECISTYKKLMESVFGEKSSWLPIGWTGGIKAQFDSTRLKNAIEDVITHQGISKTDLLNDGQPRGCKVFVCTTAKEIAGITRLRSYSLPDELDLPATICEAALATSAATGFFDPVSIGARRFVDGALGANNPVDEVEGEASNIWCSETGDLKPLVKCFISIGTGNPGTKAVEDKMLRFLSKTLVDIVTETENTERRFIAKWRQHYDEKRYFRFNIEQGLQRVRLAEYQEEGSIEAATENYLNHQGQKFRVRDCVLNLREKQNKTETAFAATVNKYNKQTIRLQTSTRKACWIVPFDRNLKFVGREAQLDGLSLLFAKGQPSKTAIVGLGGVGKTQVVLEFVYRARESDPDCSIFWLPATSIESLQQAYLEAGQQLGISGINEEQADVKKLVQERLSQESAGRWLLIFDNADDIEMWIKTDGDGHGSPVLKQYLPRSSQGRIIFTTRSRKVAVKLAQENVIGVSEMDEDIARLLLSKSLITQDLSSSDRDTLEQDALELLQQLTFLPLAIIQAAAYINENGLTFSDYLSLLKSQEQDVIDLLSEDFEDEGQYREKKNPIATTWLVSFEHIRQLDPLAAEYLSFMCCIHPRDIPESLLPPAQSRKKELDAIGTLSAYSFVSRRSADSLDLHRLVHLATRNWLRKEESLAKWTLTVVARLGEVLPSSHPKNRRLWRTYLPHAQYVLDSNFNENDVEARIELLRKFGICLFSDGRYNEAEKRLLSLVETETRLRGEEHPGTLKSMSGLAFIYQCQGRWKEAEELGIQTIKTMKKVLGKEDPDTLSSIDNLALIYSNQGRWKEAEELEVQVIETSKRLLGEQHPDTLISMGNLAGTYYRQSRWEDAEKLEVQVLELRKRVLGEEHPDTLISMGNLATAYWEQDRWEDAEKLEVQVLELRKRVLGEEHPDTLISMGNLARAYWRQDRWEDAEKLEVQVLELRKRVLGEEHPNTLTSMSNLAYTWKSLGRVTEASQLMEKCIELRIQKLGADHPFTIASRETLLQWKAVDSVVDS
ncbi:hypothetical protein JMJ35_008851 [Cladonia borealis]|uniref:PNPLA domain-containing protein n=1 Tax=Cladonia borealis TaxID=184061 RepID=A0AA39V6Q5_9LECA|nr:hypothetical protein JMJ35_008851 [Cladonia borealis]